MREMKSQSGIMKQKLKVGDRVEAGGITYQVNLFSTFSGTEHYGVLFNEKPVDGQNTTFRYGWIPCVVLDAMVQIVRYRVRYGGCPKCEGFYTEKDAMEWFAEYAACGVKRLDRYNRAEMQWEGYDADRGTWFDLDGLVPPPTHTSFEEAMQELQGSGHDNPFGTTVVSHK